MSSSFQELLSPTFPPDMKQASVAAADRLDFDAGPIIQTTITPPIPRWPRALEVAFNVFILLGSISIIGVLARSLSKYSGTRDIQFEGLNISWPKDLNLQPAYLILAASAMSISPSLSSVIVGFRRSRNSSYVTLEKALAAINGVLLVVWVTGDILRGVSERTPKTDLLIWLAVVGKVQPISLSATLQYAMSK